MKTIYQAPWAFAWFFCVLASYYVIRPVRETIGSSLGAEGVQKLFMIVFLTMLVANPVYSWLVARVPRKMLVHIVYRLFALCLIGFWLMMRQSAGEMPTWLAKLFFVWVSVFNLFAVSIFWSFLADSFTREQARSWYGMIAAGGTSGAICGSLLGRATVDQIGIANLLLVPVVLLEISTHLMSQTHRVARQLAQQAKPDEEVAASAEEAERPTGGSLWSGLVSIATSPYLLMICAALMISQWCGTTAYMQQTELVGSELPTAEARFKFFSNINIWQQSLTVVFQAVVAGYVMRFFGLSIALCVLPIVYLVSFAWLGAHSVLSVLAVVVVLQRSVALGIAEPAKQALFTVVSREQKYKSKAFIDTVVFRGGDVVASWAFVSLQGRFDFSTISYIMMPVIVVWLGIAWWLGKRAQSRSI